MTKEILTNITSKICTEDRVRNEVERDAASIFSFANGTVDLFGGNSINVLHSSNSAVDVIETTPKVIIEEASERFELQLVREIYAGNTKRIRIDWMDSNAINRTQNLFSIYPKCILDNNGGLIRNLERIGEVRTILLSIAKTLAPSYSDKNLFANINF